MKKFFAIAALATTAFIATPASATITIGVSVNGGAISTVATDGGSGSANYNATTGGYFYNVGATGSPLLAMPSFITQSINIQNAGGANAIIDVFVTQSDLTAFNSGLLSTFTSNTISGVSATLRSYFSSTNQLFTGALLQSATFTNPGVFSGQNLVNAPGLFSETVRYTLTFTGGPQSNFNGTANLQAVPEPATWAMMLVGFGAMGVAMRRRRSTATLAQLA